MNLSLIVALTNDRVIGRLNTIPWFLPQDMFWFKYHTLNKIVIMGRKTFESIGKKPLSNRFNIVLTRRNIIQNQYFYNNLVFVKTPEEAMWISGKICKFIFNEVMVIGGAQIYEIFLSYVNRLYMTFINTCFSGDIIFPIYRVREWSLIFNRSYSLKCGYSYCFKVFDRKFKYYNL